jgi:serine/threonine-protein kinase
VTPDGTRLLFSLDGRDLMMLDLEGGGRSSPLRSDPAHPVRPLLQTGFNERNGIVSPDGRWLAYESDESGRFEIYVRPFPDLNAGRWLASNAGGARPVWARAGQQLFYEAPGGAIMALRVYARGGGWSAGSPAKVVDAGYATLAGGVRNFDVSPDGQRFLMIKSSSNDTTPPQIVVVQNWLTELARLAPASP